MSDTGPKSLVDMSHTGLTGLLEMYETAIVELQRCFDPDVDRMIARLDAQRSYVLQVLEHRDAASTLVAPTTHKSASRGVRPGLHKNEA